MWTAILRDGSIVQEGEMRWCDVIGVAGLECSFGGKIINVEIPLGCHPVMFYTGEAASDKNGVEVLAQTIGYSDGKQEYLTKVTSLGEVIEYIGDLIH